MATAKQPGIGQGIGGGRPKRKNAVRMRLDLPSEIVELVRIRSEEDGIYEWEFIARAVSAFSERTRGNTLEQIQSIGLQIAREAAEFLEEQGNTIGSQATLHRAWKVALRIARHSLRSESLKASIEETKLYDCVRLCEGLADEQGNEVTLPAELDEEAVREMAQGGRVYVRKLIHENTHYLLLVLPDSGSVYLSSGGPARLGAWLEDGFIRMYDQDDGD